MGTRFVTVGRASELTGYTEYAIRTKISRGVWLEGFEWTYAPDHRILIDIEGYERWASREASEQ